ncbi:hypothetical protein [Nocardioides marmotae]|uniref:hypothetical protein n=1 Tax=Nocardioides marmotae TaxID=2663857 RepID=UPI0012B5A7BA|nr:hypothetical protein [Nocardioides marmotae]MBC9733474.1 hypothetical protein [Nocardioides marmotae]MTB84581.1 hypothetical protein [Nocardioides marmotae]
MHRSPWDRLVAELDTWTAAVVTEPGRIEVSAPSRDGHRDVVVVMTPEEWDDMWGVAWGDLDAAIEEVKRILGRLQRHERYAVYAQYTLEPSTGPTLPTVGIDPGLRGEWTVQDRDGRVVSRFRDWPTEERGRRPRR